ncbi:GNAT family N-acetyltransferase [Sphingomonas abietis]|uniref:GNAT family N-acetyltransferase n=1 Tax=Sphingomonas abietis TaxID=3012344 RepID=A0ABY7NJH9_9SPHN|nr:GNAT family N-acetyltransferase [Sphingomonas abietis]WBO20671.1 GNAT family N-acetyltransferase [Sphingomonas abietis]
MDRDMDERTTRSGFTFHVRTATDIDDPLLADFFAHVSEDDLRFRFLSAMPHVSEAQLRAMTHVDHRHTESFVAFTQDGSLLVATAMLACDPALAHAEVAIAIRADHKARGIGWELLHYIAGVAAARGIQTIESLESRANHAAIEVEQDSGFRMESVPDDPTVVRVVKTLSPA